jgi:hypothetical protein
MNTAVRQPDISFSHTLPQHAYHGGSVIKATVRHPDTNYRHTLPSRFTTLVVSV